MTLNQSINTSQIPPIYSGAMVYRRLLGYVKGSWGAFALSVLGYAIYAGASTGLAHLMKLLVDSIGQGLSDQRVFFPVMILLVFALRGIGTFLGLYFMAYVARQLVHHLRMALFDRFLVLPARFFDTTSSGHLVSRLTYNVEQVTGAATSALKVLIQEGFFVVGLLAYLLWLNWQLTLVLLLVMPLIGVLVRYASRRFRKLSSRIQGSMGEVTHVASEVIGGYRVVRSFGGERFEYERFNKASEYNRRQSMKMEATKAINTPVIQLIIAMAMGLLMWLALSPDLVGSMTPGEFIAFLTAAGLIAKPMRQLTEINETIQRGIAAAQDIFQHLDTQAETDTGTLELQRAQGAITFDRVSFGYSEDAPPALKQVNLSVRPGEMIALVGRSGSGKSTLASLIPRFYDVTEGEIRLDGIPLQDIRLSSLRAQVALVNQQVTLFNDSLAANIAYGIANPDRAAIEAAAKAAFVMDFAEKLPEGLDTQVGENGVMLSGGQRQRIAIARAFMKNAPILILDEATSALDTESERYIQEALKEIMKGRTTFVIAHRLSTIEQADRILVVADGEIVEEGTHEELLARQGHYAQLHHLT